MCTAGAGAAIAPPPSLTETSEPTSGQDNDEAPGKSGNAARGLGVAAKIMAKYGYKVSIMTLQLDWNLAMEFNKMNSKQIYILWQIPIWLHTL